MLHQNSGGLWDVKIGTGCEIIRRQMYVIGNDRLGFAKEWSKNRI